MDANEARGRQRRLELVEPPQEEIPARRGVERRVVVASLDALDRRERYREQRATVAHEDALRNRNRERGGRPLEHARVSAERECFSRTRQRDFESRGAERLHEIVECLQLERRHRKLVERGREDDGGYVLHALQDLETGNARQPNVEEHEIGAQVVDASHGREPVDGLAHLLNPVATSEEIAQTVARELLIV